MPETTHDVFWCILMRQIGSLNGFDSHHFFMKTIKVPVRYQGVSVPIDLIHEVRKYVVDNPQYRSMSEFIKEAIREKMNKCEVK